MSRPEDRATRRHLSRRLNLNPADKVVVTYLVVIALLILIFSDRIETWGWLCAGHALLIGIVLLLASWDTSSSRPVSASPHPPISGSPSSRLASFLHGWYAVALIGVTYKELTYLIP